MKRKNWIRHVMGESLCICAIILMSVTVYAADPYLSYGCQSSSITVKPYASKYNDVWVSILNHGRSAWNNSSAKVNISVSSNSKNTIVAGNYSESWYGLNTQTYNTSTGYTSKFTIQINSRTISDDASDFNNFAQSTVAHEFGHCFWLCDNPSTSKASLMKHTRNRNTMTIPQSFDIHNVNDKY